MRSGVLAALSLLARILSSILAVPLLAAPAPRAPEGFSVELAAGAPAVVFPMFAAADDRGRLFVAESSGGDLYAELAALTRRCRVSLLEDRDADGRFESMRVFAEGLVFPMGLAWRDGRLYVADPPELVALEDADGDGRADRRAVVLEGFGHTDNGSLHGLVFGPDGLLYMTLGSPDGYRIRREDGSWLEGSSGALIRSRPDGSRPEVLCRGFENLVEIEFLPAGEVIGTDNWFQLPQGGVRDALVHLVEGGLYPRHEDSPRGTRYPVTGPMLPPVSLFPAVASSGIARCRGAAFPPAMRGSLFTAQHNARRVQRHVLERDGSTFRSRDEDFVTSDDPDFHPSDVLEDADGSLLVVDTGGWYVQHCPTGRIRDSRAPGGIYRVRWVAAPKVDDPWGLAVPWDRAGVEDLARLLGDGRQEVRAKAQRALAARGEAAVPALEAILAAPGRGLAGDPAKEGAVWALHAVPGDAALAALRRGLETLDADLAALCARAIGLREDRTAATALALRLFLEEEHVRLAAAEALARCGGAGQVRALLGALGGRADRFLEHALVHALFRLAGQAALEAALERPSPRVQRAALLLLEQPPRRGAPRDAVIARLASEDGPLRETAVKVLLAHPEWAEDAVRLLRSFLERPELPAADAAGLRALAVAFAGRAEAVEAVAKALAGPTGPAPEATRLELVRAMTEGVLAELPATWVEALRALVRGAAPRLRAEAVRAAAVLGLAALEGDLRELAESPGEPEELRLEALRAVIPRRPELSEAAFELVLALLGPERDPLARLGAAEVASRAKLTAAQRARLLAAVEGDALVPRGLLDPAAPRPPPAEGPAGRLAALEPLLRGGSPERGRALFFGRKVGCGACHRVAGEGGPVGPDLSKVGTVRAGRDLLESIAFPSSTFAQGYETYTAVLKDGRVAGGVIARQSSETLVLRDAAGAETQLRRDQVESLERAEQSLMPEGLDGALEPEELRDLLAYLQALR